MVAAVKTPRRKPTRPVLITAISASFAEWCKGKGYDLQVERIQEWQREFRAERAVSQPFYSQYSSDELRAKEEAVLAQLSRIKAAQAARR